jgi:hypothetical protein
MQHGVSLDSGAQLNESSHALVVERGNDIIAPNSRASFCRDA